MKNPVQIKKGSVLKIIEVFIVKKSNRLSKSRYILFLLQPYWKYGKCYILTVLLMSAVLQPASAYLIALLPQKAIDAVMNDTAYNEVILLIALFTTFIVLVSAIEKVIQMAYTQMTLVKVSNKIKNDVNRKALFTDFRYYDSPDFFVKFIFAQDNYPIQAQNAVMLLPDLLRGLATVIAMTAMIAATSPVLLGITVFFVLLNAVAGLPIIKPTADYEVSLADAWRPMEYASRVLKTKENAAELRASDAGIKLLKSVHTAMERFQRVYKLFIHKVAPFHLLQGAVEPLQSACILAYIIFFVINGDKSQIGLYASLSVASTTLASGLNDAVSSLIQLLQCITNGEKIAEFFAAESVIEPHRKNALPAPEGKYEIELKNVCFGYENTPMLLKNFNLHIKPGQRIAIVGDNAAGKTTLTKLLLRLYDVNSGEVLINGMNIKEYDIHQLRLNTGTVFQDVRVLAMSLRDNLSVYSDASDEKLLSALDKVDLNEVLQKTNGNLDTMVSREFTQDGIALSGGEAQKLMLARLFTKQFGLLILDEPSSALDPLAEVRMMQNIRDLSANATTLMIAHRLSTVRDFDCIYNMQNGKIIEFGTHDELMCAKGKYYEMFVSQGERYGK